MEPDKKKQKTEVSPSEAAASTATEASKKAAKKARNKQEGRVLGVMHIPLLQSKQTGRFRPTEFTVKAKSKDFDDSTAREETEKTFIGTLVAKSVNKEIVVQSIDLGIAFDYTYKYDGNETIQGKFTTKFGDDRDFTSTPKMKKNRKSKKKTMTVSAKKNDWIKNSGGHMYFYSYQDVSDFVEDYFRGCYEFDNELDPAQIDRCYERTVPKADYKLKLYLVLSANQPNEILPLIAPPNDTQPDWEALEKLVSRRLNKEFMNANEFSEKYEELDYSTYDNLETENNSNRRFIKGIVQDYIAFLQLKKDFQDHEASVLFSPSKIVDEVWHAHLSFVDKYQRDIMAFMGDSKLIEHEPVLGDAAKLRYVTAYNAHKTLRNREGGYYSRWLGEGWPQPIVTIESALDSDDDSSNKNYPSDGMDDEIQVFLPFQNSQCG